MDNEGARRRKGTNQLDLLRSEAIKKKRNSISWTTTTEINRTKTVVKNKVSTQHGKQLSRIEFFKDRKIINLSLETDPENCGGPFGNIKWASDY